MKATIVRIPKTYLAGDPPKRLFDEIWIFEDGAIAVGRLYDDDRKCIRNTVMDGISFVLESMKGVNQALFDSWTRYEADVPFKPCVVCRRLIADDKTLTDQQHADYCTSKI